MIAARALMRFELVSWFSKVSGNALTERMATGRDLEMLGTGRLGS